MSTFLTVDELRAAAYGVDIPDGAEADASLQILIDKAEARLLAAVPSITDRIAAGTLSKDLVRGVLEDMVMRVVTNPRGIQSYSIDDYSETVGTNGSSSGLYLSDAEKALLGGVRVRAGGFGTIRINSPVWWVRG